MVPVTELRVLYVTEGHSVCPRCGGETLRLIRRSSFSGRIVKILWSCSLCRIRTLADTITATSWSWVPTRQAANMLPLESCTYK